MKSDYRLVHSEGLRSASHTTNFWSFKLNMLKGPLIRQGIAGVSHYNLWPTFQNWKDGAGLEAIKKHGKFF